MKKLFLALLMVFICGVAPAQVSAPPLSLQDETGPLLRPIYTIQCVGDGVSCEKVGTKGVVTVSGDGHDAVTLAGQDYLSLSTQQITADLIKGSNINWATVQDMVGDTQINWADVQGITGSDIIVTSSGGDTATLGSDIVSNGDFASGDTGWTVGANWSTASGGAAHTAGATEAISQTVAVTNGVTYVLNFSESGDTAGSITFTYGAQIGRTREYWDTTTDTFTANTTGNIVFSITPTTTYNGTIDNIVLAPITAPSASRITLKNSAGGTGMEIRPGGQGLLNSFIGSSAGYANTTGGSNSFIGSSAGYANTTGNYNSFIGSSAGRANTTGNYNSFIGSSAGYSNTTGGSNSFIGYLAGYENTTGSNNSFIGSSAGRYHADGTTALTTAANSVYIGAETRGFNNSDSNSIVIGHNAIGLGANTAVIGNTSTTLNQFYGSLIVTPPAVQTIAAGNTITANACGTIKMITSAGAVTTDTSNTFTAPASSNSGCCMDVVNVGSNNITLDNNANFFSSGGADVVLGEADSCRVCSSGVIWYQIGATGDN